MCMMKGYHPYHHLSGMIRDSLVWEGLKVIESCLEGVDRRNLKIINLSTHYKPGLALE
jgi:hypothetical protein